MGKRPITPGDGSEQYEDVLKAVGVRLREARQKAGLTQSELGVKADLKQSYIYELESGGTNITLRTLAKMADVLDLDVRDLLPEGRSGAPSGAGLAMLCSLLERLTLVVGEWDAQMSRRDAHVAEFMAELRSFADLRSMLQQPAAPAQAVSEPDVIRPPTKRTRAPAKTAQNRK